MSPFTIEAYTFSDHALFEMRRRGITEREVQEVIIKPEQTEEMRPGRWVCQSRFAKYGRIYLLRVFVDIDRKPAEVVTVYQTSKVSKYWR